MPASDASWEIPCVATVVEAEGCLPHCTFYRSQVACSWHGVEGAQRVTSRRSQVSAVQFPKVSSVTLTTGDRPSCRVGRTGYRQAPAGLSFARDTLQLCVPAILSSSKTGKRLVVLSRPRRAVDFLKTCKALAPKGARSISSWGQVGTCSSASCASRARDIRSARSCQAHALSLARRA